MNGSSHVNGELLDQLADVGNKALNDHYHEDLCHCSKWPESCASTGKYFFGNWDTEAFAIALPAIIAAYEAQRAGAADTIRNARGAAS
jgi:hypothetical protein